MASIDSDGGWNGAEIIIYREVEKRSRRIDSMGESLNIGVTRQLEVLKTFSLPPGKYYSDETFSLSPGCYDTSESSSSASSQGSWKITQNFQDNLGVDLKSRTLGTGDASWICTAGYSLPIRCVNSPDTPDCLDQERAAMELLSRGIVVPGRAQTPSPTPTTPSASDPGVAPTSQQGKMIVASNNDDNYLVPVAIGAGVLLLVVATAGVFVVRRNKATGGGWAEEEDGDDLWATDTPFSPPTMKVVRAMNGEIVDSSSSGLHEDGEE